MQPTAISVTEIWTDKANLASTRVQQSQMEPAQLQADEVILATDSFGFSANNVTYALLGDRLGYWGFFPAAEGWGIIPVWGFATVVASQHPQVSVGEKVFGYLPMASHLRITVGKHNEFGFSDISERRRSISPVYDQYLRCDKDPGYDPTQEAWQLNFRPLFMTSFVLDDYVGEQMAEDVTDIVLTSASSKTAYGTAFLLKHFRASRGKPYRVIGLTSESNRETSEQLGCYDQVLSYADLEQLDVSQSAWVLDFAGNKQTLLDLQSKLTSQLAQCLFIGVTDVAAQRDKQGGEVKGEMFFAPSQVKKRIGEWGQAEFNLRYAQAWQQVFGQIRDLLHIKTMHGADAVTQLYLQTLAGKADTNQLNVLDFATD